MFENRLWHIREKWDSMFPKNGLHQAAFSWCNPISKELPKLSQESTVSNVIVPKFVQIPWEGIFSSISWPDCVVDFIASFIVKSDNLYTKRFHKSWKITVRISWTNVELPISFKTVPYPTFKLEFNSYNLYNYRCRFYCKSCCADCAKILLSVQDLFPAVNT